MTQWTNEQLKAINESGKNIIVSAGAGSGKTAVLTQRVITKIKNGIDINRLLILTFTNAAAGEMKDRIRREIKKDVSLKDQLDYIDNAYITTFDSFSMSVVKKYNYLLNVSPNIKILDSSICDIVRNEILDNIFEEKYKNRDKSFIKLVNDLTLKDDKDLKKSILNINIKLDRLINKEEYLLNYLENYYSIENINKLYNLFIDALKNKLNKIKELLDDLYNYCDIKYYEKVNSSLKELLLSNDYEHIKQNINVSLPRVPNNSENELKEIKSKISDELKLLKKKLIYKDSNHIIDTLKSTYDYSDAIIKIILELDKRLNNYKNSCDEYEFNDIANMAIKVVTENEEIRDELKNSFDEIMVDEYQDTSDIQETFINLISNNNVYMVGDVKQSIYRFRNANPNIFKDKYDLYSNSDIGIKIDLLNNFRSREEVLQDINNIFNLIMDNNIGGADYKLSHQMKFGNKMYIDNKSNANYNLEIYNYDRDNKKYKESEYEAFIIANDIKNKINNDYQVIDKQTGKLRKVDYKDFCILIDRKTNFETYKKIFEYLGVPLLIYYDEKITNEKDVLIIKNIIDLIVKIYKNEFDKKFKYDFYSIARSYLFDLNDQEFVEFYLNNTYINSDIYKKCLSIASNLDKLSNRTLIDEIIEKFEFYENAIKVGEIEKLFVRIDYLKTLADNLSSLGYNIFMFNEYLNDMVINDSDITFSLNTKSENNVKLMNVHKSKGLEFSICYFAGYSSKFNRQELNLNINFDQNLGFILPFYDSGLGNTITKELFNNKYIYEDISERIRLFYVALTRAKEKMIIVANLSDKSIKLSDNTRLEYNSFLSIIESIKEYLPEKIVKIENIKLTKEYLYSKNKINKFEEQKEKINIHEINISNENIENSNVSKKINKLLTNDDIKLLEYGTSMHELFEMTDFNNTDNEIISKFINNFENIKDAKIYKEYEFITTIDQIKYHGIIDLILEYEKYINIVDYKLKNISDENYKKQLSIYKKYIDNLTGKIVNTYLYSIVENKLIKMD